MFNLTHKKCGGDVIEVNNEGAHCDKCNQWIWDEDDILVKHCIIPEQDIEVISRQLGLTG